MAKSAGDSWKEIVRTANLLKKQRERSAMERYRQYVASKGRQPEDFDACELVHFTSDAEILADLVEKLDERGGPCS